MPNPNISHPLTSKVMVVNKDGDLELYAIYDTPKQSIWSSRGDLAIGAGVGVKIIAGHQNTALVNPLSSDGVGQARSIFKYSNMDTISRSPRSVPTREHSLARGRSGRRPGCPPSPIPGVDLSLSAILTGLSATRPGKTRTYSPASVRKYRRSVSRTDTIFAEDSSDIQNINSPRRRTKSREMKKVSFLRVLQGDISMIMRRRALAGYGLSKVCYYRIFFYIGCLLFCLLAPGQYQCNPRTI